MPVRETPLVCRQAETERGRNEFQTQTTLVGGEWGVSGD